MKAAVSSRRSSGDLAPAFFQEPIGLALPLRNAATRPSSAPASASARETGESSGSKAGGGGVNGAADLVPEHLPVLIGVAAFGQLAQARHIRAGGLQVAGHFVQRGDRRAGAEF